MTARSGQAIVAEIAQRGLSAAALARLKGRIAGEVSLASIAGLADDVRPWKPECERASGDA